MNRYGLSRRLATRVVALLSRKIDITATLLEMVAVSIPSGVQGRSFLPMLFQSADASKLTSAPQLFLNRAKKRGDIHLIIRGYYINTWKTRITGETPTIEQIACFVRRPSYISCEWALNAHNILDQAPSVCTVITLSSSVGQRNRIDLGEVVIEYSKIKPKLFKDFEFTNGAHIASPEKAILDTIYY